MSDLSEAIASGLFDVVPQLYAGHRLVAVAILPRRARGRGGSNPYQDGHLDRRRGQIHTVSGFGGGGL